MTNEGEIPLKLSVPKLILSTKPSRNLYDLQPFQRGQEIMDSQIKLSLTLPASVSLHSLYQDSTEEFPALNSLPRSFIPDLHSRKVFLCRPSHQLILPSTPLYSQPALVSFISCSQLLETIEDKKQTTQQYWLDIGGINVWQWSSDYLMKPSIPSQRVINVLLFAVPSPSSPPSSRWETILLIFVPLAFMHQHKGLNVTVWGRGLLVGLAHRREGYADR